MKAIKYENPWPPVEPEDEKFYDIELTDGTCVEHVEYWLFGGGFTPSNEAQFIEYPLEIVRSFSLAKDP